MRKLLLIIFVILHFGFSVYGQNHFQHSSSANEILSKLKHLSAQQLLDTAEYFVVQNNNAAALICFNLIVNMPVKDTDEAQLKRMIEAYNKSAVLNYYMCDFRTAYELLLNALNLCEKIDYKYYKSKIYANIGNIYYRFNKFDLAKLYYSKALDICTDSATMVVILNNLGTADIERGELDSALHFLNEALHIIKNKDDRHAYFALNTKASYYQKVAQYDSAYRYFQGALADAEKHHQTEKEAEILSNLSKMFFETNNIDSALFYINLSNEIAEENGFLGFLAENYLTLSKIEESKGRKVKAFEYFKIHAGLKDSIFDVAVFGEINQLQHLYEVSKTNQQIEKLLVEQKIKERTIHYQKIIWMITSCLLILVSMGLLFIYFQKRNLSRAYKVLVEKNLKIIELQENASEKHLKKYEKSALSDELQHELLDKILNVMEDTSIIFDTKFSIDKLAEMVHSNHKYVSQVINHALKMNFRSFLNSYRVQEAQRLFSNPDSGKYTIEAIALQVGFKSQSSFRDAFKEITGVSPNFYLKSMQEQ